MGPGAVKRSISLDVNYKVNFKDFIPNVVCVLKKKIFKTYRTGFLFCSLGPALEVGLGVLGGQNFEFRPSVRYATSS